MTDRFSTADWQKLKDEMRAILIGVARLKTTITYSELAAELTIAHVHHRAPYFHKLLRELCDDEEASGRPPLAALVVRKDTGICGAGYFADLPVIEGEIADPIAYWRADFERICAYWERQ
ncbi:MAG: hypothetical protein MUF87_12510 [Anaerolineae bacterium]|jgi:hypothetical protein|nr:hypothetical protein [Anaerolineae bacterium]